MTVDKKGEEKEEKKVHRAPRPPKYIIRKSNL